MAGSADCEASRTDNSSSVADCNIIPLWDASRASLSDLIVFRLIYTLNPPSPTWGNLRREGGNSQRLRQQTLNPPRPASIKRQVNLQLLFLHNDHIFLFSSLPDDHGRETRYRDCESECPCFLWDTADFCTIDVIHENKFKPRRERSA
jgi:hypothetical protein